MRGMSRGVLAIPALLMICTGAVAETFRCDGHIIERGMNSSEVRKHCGPPDAENLIDGRSWSYNRGTTGMTIVVHFYANGDVERIESVRD